MNKWNERPEKETEGGINIKNKMSVATFIIHTVGILQRSLHAHVHKYKKETSIKMKNEKPTHLLISV